MRRSGLWPNGLSWAGLIAPYPTRAEAGKRAAGSYFAASLFSPRIRTLARALARLP